jgi:type IV pilus assembly protein PilW
VVNSAGETQFLTANQVDTATDASGNAITCPPGSANPVVTGAIQGCLWRAVQSVEVDLLMDGQVPLYTLSPDEERYTYSFDTTTTALAAPSAHAVKPSSDQGFPDQLLRREFTALIAVRNYNP